MVVYGYLQDYLTLEPSPLNTASIQAQSIIAGLKEQWLFTSRLLDNAQPRDLILIYNTRGIWSQRYGRFAEAERCHRLALELCISKESQESERNLAPVLRYNIMLAMARGGRLDEALHFRDTHREEISSEEIIYGALETRLEEMVKRMRPTL